jgi:hypothetical protein
MTRISDPAFRLRDQHVAPSFPEEVKLGYHLGSSKPTLKLSDYLDTATAQPPAAVSRAHPGFAWGMLMNDTLGDCVCAMILHAIEDFHLDAGTAPPAFTNADATLLYEKIGGYVPSDPSSDQGCDETVAMTDWQAGLPKTSDGVVHKIVGTVAIDPTKLTEVRIGIDEFVDVMMGDAMPLSAQGQTEWTVVGDGQSGNSAPGSWGGHGTPANSYDPDTMGLITWGAPLLCTVPFWLAYVQEAHVVVTQEMLSKTGVGASGVQWDDLVADLKAQFVAVPTS